MLRRNVSRAEPVLAAPQSVENLPCCIPLLSTLRCLRAELEPEPDFPRGHPGHMYICMYIQSDVQYMQELLHARSRDQSVLCSVSILNIIAKASAPQSSFEEERNKGLKKK